MSHVLLGLAGLISLYLFVLFGRVILEWVSFVNRSWRPRGALLVIANTVYVLTDPPLRWLSRVLPPLRIGPVAIDLGFLVLFFGLSLLANVLRVLA